MPLTLTLSGITDGQQIDASDVTTPFNEVKAFADVLETNLSTESSTRASSIANVLAGNSAFSQLSVGTDTALTIASGAVTVTRTRHLVDTEASAATDDLDTISGGVEGDLLILQSVNAGRVVTVKHNTGNLYLFGGQDIALSNPQQALALMWDGTRWCQLASPQGSIALREETDSTNVPVTALTLPAGTLISDAIPPRLALMPDLIARNAFAFRASAATILPDQVAAPTTVGTLAVSNESDSTYVSATSGAVAGNNGGFVSASLNLVRRGYNPMFEALIRTGSTVADARFWLGFFSIAPTNVDDLAGATQGIAFRYSAPAGDTGWRAVCDDGTSATVSTNLTTVTADTRYLLRIRMDSAAGIAYFSINNGAETAVSTNLPAVGTDLGVAVYVFTNIAVARVLKFSRCLVRYD
jgi:hypothetical protein